MQGDACNIPQNIGPFDVVLASNLLCRLPDPYLFLRRLPTLVRLLPPSCFPSSSSLEYLSSLAPPIAITPFPSLSSFASPPLICCLH